MKVFQIIGGIALGRLLLGGAANALSSKISYSLTPMRLSDFSIRFTDGVILGVLTLRIKLKNETGVNLVASSFAAVVSQQGAKLGDVLTSNQVQLIHGQEKVLAVKVNIGATAFLTRVQQYLNKTADFMAPLDIRGKLTFTNGQSIVINRQLQFFAIQ